jgi:beta-galactosidase
MYLGVDYYPEQWDQELLEQDLARMANSSMNCIRIAEFAWHLFEPQEGAYRFDYFLGVLDRAHHYGLKVMLGTPTATLPAWLAQKHPEVLSVDELGMKRHFGGRRQACLNSPAYVAASEAITTRMATAYQGHPAVIAWQIDNELGHETSDWCYCLHCEREFQNFLKSEFTEIEDLNRRLGTVFWSQTYNDFCEISVPKPTIPARNPGLLLYFYRFRAWTITRFARRQAAVLRGIVPASQSITHNYPGDYYNKAQNFTDISEALDVVALNNYPVWGGLEQPVEYGKTAMKLDQTRGFLAGKHFWITEQLIGAQAHTIMGYLPRPGQARLWSWQALLHGCNHLIYFRWRTASRGAEQFCYGVLDQDNQDGPRYQEMVKVFQEARQYEQKINLPVEAKVALLYNPDNVYAWKIQPQSTGMDVHHEHFRLYQGFKRQNIPVDVLDERHGLENYSVVLVPAPMLITFKQIEKLSQFLHRGGTVISSFRAGIKDADNAVYFNRPNPWLELAQIKSYYVESLGSGRTVQVTDGNQNHSATVWRDMIEILNSQQVTSLYKYCDEFSEYSAVTSSQVGAGQLIHVGCAISGETFWIDLCASTARKHGIPCHLTPYGVEKIWRGSTQFILNHNSFEVDCDEFRLKPYDVLFVESDR